MSEREGAQPIIAREPISHAPPSTTTFTTRGARASTRATRSKVFVHSLSTRLADLRMVDEPPMLRRFTCGYVSL